MPHTDWIMPEIKSLHVNDSTCRYNIGNTAILDCRALGVHRSERNLTRHTKFTGKLTKLWWVLSLSFVAVAYTMLRSNLPKAYESGGHDPSFEQTAVSTSNQKMGHTSLPSCKGGALSPCCRPTCELFAVTYHDSPSVLREKLSPYIEKLEKSSCCQNQAHLLIVCKERSKYSLKDGCSWISANVGGENFDIIQRVNSFYDSPPKIFLTVSEQRLRSPDSGLRRLHQIIQFITLHCDQLERDYYFDGAIHHDFLGEEKIHHTPSGEKFVEGYNFTLTHWLGGTRQKMVEELQSTAGSDNFESIEQLLAEGKLLPAETQPYGKWAEQNLFSRNDSFQHMSDVGVTWSQAMFATVCRGIRQRTKNTYGVLADQLSLGVNTEVGHYVERSYMFLFHREGRI